MSIIDRVISNLPGPLGKGPGGLPAPHNMSWGSPHEQAHRGGGDRGFPTRPDTGARGQGPDGLGPPGLLRQGGPLPAPPPGLAPAPPGMPPGVDRPAGTGWGPGPERPQGPGTPAPGAERPNGNGWDAGRPGPGTPAPVQGGERPLPLAPGQVIRDVLGGPRQMPVHQPVPPQAPQVPGSPQQPGVPGQGGLANGLLAGAATPMSAQQMAQPAQLPLPAAPRADAGAPQATAQRADGLAQGAQVAPGMRADAGQLAARPADAGLVPRTQDPGLANLQRSSTAHAAAATTAAAATAPGATQASATTAATLASAAAAATVAGSTMASAPPAAAQAAEARTAGNPLAVNDRGLPLRPDAAGYTGEGPQRRGLDRRPRVLEGGLSSLLVALGAQGHTGASGRDPAAVERELREAMMQWLFWLLAIIAYGCLGLAIVALLPVGGQVLGDSARTWTGGSALVGLLTAAVAWLLAKRLGARRP